MPSFFLTRTTGLAHGLLDGCITPVSCIILSCRATSCRTVKGIRLTGSFLGAASPVSISNCTRSVSPRSFSSRQNALWWLARNSSSILLPSSGKLGSSINSINLACRCRTVSAVTLLTPSGSVDPGDSVGGKARSPGWPGRSSLAPKVDWMTVAGMAISSSRPCSTTCVNPEGLDKTI